MFVLFALFQSLEMQKLSKNHKKIRANPRLCQKDQRIILNTIPLSRFSLAGVQPPGVRVPGDGEARDLLPQVRGDRPSLWPPHQGDTVPGQGDEGELQEPHLREIRGEEDDCKCVRESKVGGEIEFNLRPMGYHHVASPLK